MQCLGLSRQRRHAERAVLGAASSWLSPCSARPRLQTPAPVGQSDRSTLARAAPMAPTSLEHCLEFLDLPLDVLGYIAEKLEVKQRCVGNTRARPPSFLEFHAAAAPTAAAAALVASISALLNTPFHAGCRVRLAATCWTLHAASAHSFRHDIFKVYCSEHSFAHLAWLSRMQGEKSNRARKIAAPSLYCCQNTRTPLELQCKWTSV